MKTRLKFRPELPFVTIVTALAGYRLSPWNNGDWRHSPLYGQRRSAGAYAVFARVLPGLIEYHEASLEDRCRTTGSGGVARVSSIPVMDN